MERVCRSFEFYHKYFTWPQVEYFFSFCVAPGKPLQVLENRGETENPGAREGKAFSAWVGHEGVTQAVSDWSPR